MNDIEHLRASYEYALRCEKNEVERLTAELAALKSIRRWIPVTESLPEFDVDVLVSDGKRVQVGHTYLGINCEKFWYFQGMYDMVITHWQPLPLPPESEEA